MADLSNFLFGAVSDINADFVAQFCSLILLIDVIKSVVNVIGGISK